MPHGNPVVSLPLMGMALTFGNLAIWTGLAAAITCVFLYWFAMLRTMRLHPEGTAAAGNGNGSGAASGAEPGKKGGKRRATPAENASPEDRQTDQIALLAR